MIVDMKSKCAKQELYKYTAIQEQLCDALFEKHPIDDIDFLTDLPRYGSLTVGDGFWEFQRHGLGVCFTESSTGEIVDAHVDLFAQKRGIDACRLVQYFESIGVEKLIDDGMEFDATNEAPLMEMLNRMCLNGWLVLANKDRHIYLINN